MLVGHAVKMDGTSLDRTHFAFINAEVRLRARLPERSGIALAGFEALIDQYLTREPDTQTPHGDERQIESTSFCFSAQATQQCIEAATLGAQCIVFQ